MLDDSGLSFCTLYRDPHIGASAPTLLFVVVQAGMPGFRASGAASSCKMPTALG